MGGSTGTGFLARAAAAMTIAAAMAAGVVYIREASRGSAPAAPPAASAPAFRTNAECALCHAEIAAEWARDAHAAAWLEGPLFARDPKQVECSACHASNPIFETGLDRPVTVRADRHEEGIGCIECHRSGDGVRGPGPAGPGACNPARDEAFAGVAVCAPCHAAHGTIDEWRASAWAAQGVTCQECHMPAVERPGPGGVARRARSHAMRSHRDLEFLRGAVTVTARAEGGEVAIAIRNHGAGHSFPGEIWNREAFLKTEVLGGDGATLLARRESMRTPRRQQRATDESTQVRAGETRRYAYALPEGWRRVRVVLGYKSFFLDPDGRAVKMWEATLVAPNER